MLPEFWAFAEKRLMLLVDGATDDEILQEYRFTNCYRALDRVSQYLIREVQVGDDVLFRTMLFKLFNKIETWELLRDEVGVEWRSGWIEDTEAFLNSRVDSEGRTGRGMYSPAFRHPSGRGQWGHATRWRNHLALICSVVERQDELKGCGCLEDVYQFFLSVPMLGPFLSMQFATDIGYTSLVSCDDWENQWVQPGPGCRRGVSKVAGAWQIDGVRKVVCEVAREQPEVFERVTGRMLSLMDVQNLFCEFDKYLRVARPDLSGVGRGGRKPLVRPKQVYTPSERGRLVWPEDYRWPPKWGVACGT